MTVSPANSGNVKVNGTVYTTSCGYSPGTNLNMEAVASQNYKFDRWGGALSGSTNPTTLKMDTSKNVTAYFRLKTEAVSLSGAKNLTDTNKDLIVIDASTSAEYGTAHMLCARSYIWNAAAGNFTTVITNLNPYKSDDLLVYDRFGTKSGDAAEYLANQGFNSVYYMTDGLDDWMAAGYETFMTAEDAGICTSLAPMAYAGADMTVNEGAQVTLNGSGSDPDGGTVTYSWTQTEGTGVTLSSTTAAKPTFKAPVPSGGDDTLIFHLTVTDDEKQKDTDSVTVHVTWINDPPTAVAAADKTAPKPGDTVTLDGSGSSDPENGTLTYNWMATAGTLMINLASPNSQKPTFVVPAGTPALRWVEFTLTVTDNGLKTASAKIKITVQGSSNQPPSACAGDNQTVTEGSTVQLDGSCSIDPDDGIKKYTWSQTGGPNVSLSPSIYAVKPTFTAPQVTQNTPLNFKLTVEDNGGLTHSNTVTVTVTDSGSSTDVPAPPTNVSATDGTLSGRVRITWAASAGAQSYEVYRADMPSWTGATMTRIASPVTGTTYDDTTAQTGSRYYYWIKARNANGVSAFSAFDPGYFGTIGTAPPRPGNVSASDSTAAKVTITWGASARALVYEVYRADIPVFLGGSIKKIATVTAMTHDDTTAVAGKQYYYWIKARNSWGVSLYSLYDTGYCCGAKQSPPAAPTGVSATDGGSGKVTVTWSASTGAIIYEIWRADKPASQGGQQVRIGKTDSSTFTFEDTSLTCGVKYYYWVKARDSWGSSKYSQYDTGYCGSLP